MQRKYMPHEQRNSGGRPSATPNHQQPKCNAPPRRLNCQARLRTQWPRRAATTLACVNLQERLRARRRCPYPCPTFGRLGGQLCGTPSGGWVGGWASGWEGGTEDAEVGMGGETHSVKLASQSSDQAKNLCRPQICCPAADQCANSTALSKSKLYETAHGKILRRPLATSAPYPTPGADHM